MITTRLAALFIVPAYSAFILTFILYPDARLPFTDIKGLVQDGSYKIAFLKNQNWDNWFRVNLTFYFSALNVAKA